MGGVRLGVGFVVNVGGGGGAVLVLVAVVVVGGKMRVEVRAY